MRTILLLCFCLFGLFLNAQSAEKIIGKWEYEDVHDKEGIDETGLKMLKSFLDGTYFHFDESGKFKGIIMGNEDEGNWSFSEEPLGINIESKKGETVTLQILEFSEEKMSIAIDRLSLVLVKTAVEDSEE